MDLRYCWDQTYQKKSWVFMKHPLPESGNVSSDFHSLYFLMKFLQSVFVDGFFTVCISWWSLPNTDSLSSGPQAQATHSWKLGRWAQTYFRCLLNITRTDICMCRLAKSHGFLCGKGISKTIFSQHKHKCYPRFKQWLSIIRGKYSVM